MHIVNSKDPLPTDTLQACLSSEAVLLGAVGGPSFDGLPKHFARRAGLLRIRRSSAFLPICGRLCAFRARRLFSVAPEVVHGMDVLIVRELLGGLYFGEPRSIKGRPDNRVAMDTMRYGEPEIERIAHVAFELARSRRRKVTSVDKANVLDCSRLWRDVVTRVGQNYPDVKLSHM